MSLTEPFRRLHSGLTLIELVVAMAVAGILLAGGYGIFLSHQRTYAVQDQVVEIQQNARVAMNLLARDLRMAGHGVPKLWPVDIGGITYSDPVTAVGTTLTLLGCFGAPEGYLSTSADIGATQIELVDASDFDTVDRRYIFIGEYDKVIINFKDGNKLTLNQGLKKRYPTTRLSADADSGDTDISVDTPHSFLVGDIVTLGDERFYVTGIAGNTITFNKPLQFEYPSSARLNPIPVYRVQALRYAINADGIITRQDLETGGPRRQLAENIQTLAITPISSTVYGISLTARTSVPDDAGRFRSRTYTFTVKVRNPL